MRLQACGHVPLNSKGAVGACTIPLLQALLHNVCMTSVDGKHVFLGVLTHSSLPVFLFCAQMEVRVGNSPCAHKCCFCPSASQPITFSCQCTSRANAPLIPMHPSYQCTSHVNAPLMLTHPVLSTS